MKKNFSLGMAKNWKVDSTPVTETDLAINNMVLKAVDSEYPAYSFIGEEGSNMKESDYAWVCDPIDGTMPFSLGLPTFAFSLALTKDGESVLGVIYDPMSDRLLTAEKREGAFLNGAPISVTKNARLGQTSFIETGGYSVLPELQANLAKKTGCRIVTIFSCVYGGMLVAAGEFEAQVHKYDKPWDVAAVKIIVEEAGGKATSLSGREQRYDRPIEGFVASNGLVHREILDIIAETKIQAYERTQRNKF